MTRLALLLLGAALTLTGCSQVAAIAPVGGDRVAEVRYAALDILVKEAIEVLTVPACSMTDDRAVSCIGTTVDGKTIAVESTAADQSVLSVVVDGTVIYSGSIQDVLTDALERP